ncbi:nucleoside/nucleotide kinase family protein [Zhengella sp. ZM62]|uniref:nucleoside/nucleotide kinase family protein n=1 Tax=Zhengella sedimenti TaxID=3390035 RepID=UPI003974D7A4
MSARRVSNGDLAGLIAEAAAGRERYTVAIAGAPGAGKSTLAAGLARTLGGRAVVVPMDGFHLDNAILEARGLMAVKGAPETFDVAGFAALLGRLATEDAVAIPVFDRAADLSRAGAAIVSTATPIRIVEGNYLLIDRPGWRSLRPHFDLAVILDVPEAELERRLVQRWLAHGLDPQAARSRALGNDIPNARLVAAESSGADLIVS